MERREQWHLVIDRPITDEQYTENVRSEGDGLARMANLMNGNPYIGKIDLVHTDEHGNENIKATRYDPAWAARYGL